MTESATVVALQRQYVTLLKGDVLAALMLSQIYYWYQPAKNGSSKLRVFRFGKWWLAKSHKDWEEEIGLTRKQSRRCLEVLVEAGILEVSTLKFDGSPTTHCRLVMVDGREVLTDPIGLFSNSHCAEKQIALYPKGQSLTETTTETTTKSKTATDVAGEQGTDMTTKAIAEILASHNAKKAELPTGKVTPITLALLWKKRVSVLTDTGFMKPLTGKEVGQLKHVHKALGDKSLTVLDYALCNWADFSWEARSVKGLSSCPAQPVVGFFALYFDVAAQLIAKPPTTTAAKAPKPLPAPVVAVKTLATPVAGADDINATMALLDKLAG
jgi:hypothetical protein